MLLEEPRTDFITALNGLARLKTGSFSPSLSHLLGTERGDETASGSNTVSVFNLRSLVTPSMKGWRRSYHLPAENRECARAGLRPWFRRSGVTIIAMLSAFHSGCTTFRATPADYSARVASGSSQSLLATSESELVRHGYRVERRDDRDGIIQGVSDEFPASGIGIGIRSRSRVRRHAEVRIQETQGQIEVFCRVFIQEQATQAHRLAAPDSRSTDRPGDTTAIDRDAATTSQQNSVWRNVRRDKPAERELLAVIVPSMSP